MVVLTPEGTYDSLKFFFGQDDSLKFDSLAVYLFWCLI